jgi:FHA domain-containing protein
LPARSSDDRTLRTADSAGVDRQPNTVWGITVLHSPALDRIGASFSIAPRLRLGRAASDDVDIVIEDPKMSRWHATLTRSGLVVTLRDEGIVEAQRAAALLRLGGGDRTASAKIST